MVTGFEIWGHDAGLRRHWRARTLAALVDALISFLPVSLALYISGVNDIVSAGMWNSVALYLVSSIPEAVAGQTPGKRLLGLRTYDEHGGMPGARAWLRNVSRLLWFVLLPLDVTLGLATRGDPRQRLLDRLAGTKVVHRSEVERHREVLEALADADAGEPVADERPGERCRECGGALILLADGKLQCEGCGLIQ